MRLAHDAFGGAAKPDVFQARVTVRRQDNQVHRQRLGGFANLFVRFAFPDGGGNFYSERFGKVCRRAVGLRFDRHFEHTIRAFAEELVCLGNFI